jgi:2,3-dihydroxyphenylpropionate 1,2-dioxygenase
VSTIVYGVAASHSTLMNTHWHEVDGLDRAEAFRDGLLATRALIVAARPDVVIIIGSNHFRGFWLDLMPAFTIGVGECVASGESGTPSGPQRVDTQLARHMVSHLVDNDFDVAFSANLQIDHGITHAIQWLLAGLDVPIVPVVVNVFAPPLPTMRRCEQLAAAMREAISRDGADKRVVVIGSGGLSHALPFPQWDAPVSEDDHFMVDAWTNGRNRWQEFDPRRRDIIRASAPLLNDAFDHEVLSLASAGQLHEASTWTSTDIAQRGGNGAQETRTWLMAAAMCDHAPAQVIAHSPMPEWLTAMAICVFEPDAGRVSNPALPTADNTEGTS